MGRALLELAETEADAPLKTQPDPPPGPADVRFASGLYLACSWRTLDDVLPTSPLSVSEARRQLAAIIDRVGAEHAPVYLARRGRRVAAVIDADDLDRILALAEDMTDIRAADEAREEMRATGDAPIPWEQVKADLGLT